MKSKFILKYFIVFLPSCSPIIESEIEGIIEEGIEIRRHSLEEQKSVKLGKDF